MQTTQEPQPTAALHTVKDAAQILGISLSAMHKLVRTRQIEYIELGTELKPKRRIHPDVVKAFLQERTVPALGDAA